MSLKLCSFNLANLVQLRLKNEGKSGPKWETLIVGGFIDSMVNVNNLLVVLILVLLNVF